MCGIAGSIGKPLIGDSTIDKTLALMFNRGPDHQAAVRFSQGDTHVVLLASRLSIIDLDDRSNQPFSIGDWTIVYNGEIYNYLELRQELKDRGVVFRTDSDTEVLLQSYIHWGEDCVQRFEGMWAFAIFNQRSGLLFLSRDRFGEKPLYYMETNEGFYFASQTSILRQLCGREFTINDQQVLRYLVNGYKSLYKGNETFFLGVEEVPFATNLVVTGEGKKNQYRYWQPEYRPDSAISRADAIEGTRHWLLESIRLRLRSDVPLAFCLSGGVDSASLVSIAAKHFGQSLETFSIISDDERYNEEDNIDATLSDIGSPNHKIRLSPDTSLDDLAQLIEYHDAPIYTIAYYIHSKLSKAINERGLRVSFSGTSADELFTGYFDHFNFYLYEMRDSPHFAEYLADWNDGPGRYVRNPYLRNPTVFIENPDLRDHIYLNAPEFGEYLVNPFSEAFSETHFCEPVLRRRMLNELFHESTPAILHEDDLNSMFYSVENRSPFLDSRLFSFAYSIDTEHLIQDGYGKHILREAVGGILNDDVRLDRRKKGFNAPVTSIVDFDDPEVREFLLDPQAKVFEYVDRNKIGQLVKHLPQSNSYSKFMFNFVNLRLFLQ